MKKILILFLIIGSFCFAGTISSVNEKGSNLSFVFTGNAKSAYQISYDSYNRLIFIEFPGSKLSTKINDKNYTSKYIEDFSVVNYGNAVGFFIKLNKNISYSTAFKGNDFVFTFNDKSGKKQYTIAIDAGHGGKDPGAIGFKKYYEKNIALAVAKYLRDELKKDFNVVMTRDKDIFVTLGERPRIANRAKADMFVSIHANSALKNTLSGTEVFYFSKKSSPYAERIAAFENSVGDKYGEKTNNIVQIMGELAYKKNQEISIGFARKTSAALARVIGIKDRGIHGANFAVLRGFNGPGVLIELGFINNKGDLNKLINTTNQKKMAQEIAKMIRENFY
ncbi:N-acetylmuramoyl-L-alanine amidase AmiB precursor [Fusobacterium necrogenes]|uniref:N-acetylmuramoyl-L-alanine amidase AmiB n=1 Tax=Fusobacterium necrogenes TaxID=858 RepID=A0A377GUV2_9FUSO|nr:N-acetylmuramoyl-L-alanine amidase [Fusobacterium necrogenes]STO30719.1 N-acetylmuramoyl-L-alanine amidase AmiB precursor [Fusobacterium necrogenes]